MGWNCQGGEYRRLDGGPGTPAGLEFADLENAWLELASLELVGKSVVSNGILSGPDWQSGE